MNVSQKSEYIRRFVHKLPVRRSQVSNWLIKLFSVEHEFIGTFLDKKIEVHPDDASSRSAYFLGYYERETTLWTLDYIKRKKPSVVIDVGAHFGYFVYLCTVGNLRPKIYAFEPDPFNYEWLKRNIRLNQLESKVEIINKAVSHNRGAISFIPSIPEEGKTLWAKMDTEGLDVNSNIIVETLSLDEFCSEHQLTSVDLLKMDIEGGEGLAIDGMSDGIKKHVYKNVLLEIHPNSLDEDHPPEKIIKKFKDNGYKAYHFEQSYQDKKIDKRWGTYTSFRWKPAMMKEIDHTAPMLGWDHILFTVEE